MTEAAMDDEWGGGFMDVPLRCPQCHSTRIDTRGLARRFGGAIGAIVGTTGGVAAAVAGAEVGLLAGPIGVILGAAAGVVIEGIVGGATGCTANFRLGEAVDRNFLHDHRYRACGNTLGDKFGGATASCRGSFRPFSLVAA